MNKADPPTSFGIFKPIGHTVMAFQDVAQVHEAQASLASIGFTSESMVWYAADEMLAQINAQLESHNPLANFGYELDLINAHKVLAQQGCSFLVVEAQTDALAEQVAVVVKRMRPASAQHYGRLMIEDLTEKPPATPHGTEVAASER
jgi:hypothetical protein